jgi:hypothetical protein
LCKGLSSVSQTVRTAKTSRQRHHHEGVPEKASVAAKVSLGVRCCCSLIAFARTDAKAGHTAREITSGPSEEGDGRRMLAMDFVLRVSARLTLPDQLPRHALGMIVVEQATCSDDLQSSFSGLLSAATEPSRQMPATSSILGGSSHLTLPH